MEDVREFFFAFKVRLLINLAECISLLIELANFKRTVF